MLMMITDAVTALQLVTIYDFFLARLSHADTIMCFQKLHHIKTQKISNAQVTKTATHPFTGMLPDTPDHIININQSNKYQSSTVIHFHKHTNCKQEEGYSKFN